MTSTRSTDTAPAIGAEGVPAAPREVPVDFTDTYVAQSKVRRAFTSMFVVPSLVLSGVALTSFFIAAGTVVPLVASAVALLCVTFLLRSWWRNFAIVQRRRLALAEGDAFPAEIRLVGQSQYSAGNEHATVYGFEFEMDGRTFRGEHHTWEAVDLEQGDEVAVLCRRSDPYAAVIYDPGRYGAPGRRGSRPPSSVRSAEELETEAEAVI